MILSDSCIVISDQAAVVGSCCPASLIIYNWTIRITQKDKAQTWENFSLKLYSQITNLGAISFPWILTSSQRNPDTIMFPLPSQHLVTTVHHPRYPPHPHAHPKPHLPALTTVSRLIATLSSLTGKAALPSPPSTPAVILPTSTDSVMEDRDAGRHARMTTVDTIHSGSCLLV